MNRPEHAGLAVGNPFSTRHTRPGAVPYLFSPGQTLEGLLSKLALSDWWGEIVGPHGSGKSTLLARLIEVAPQHRRWPLLIALHDRQRSLPIDLTKRTDLDGSTLIVVDGYEQLGRWQRMRLKQLCRRQGWGLLVTSHASVGLPRLYETAVTLDLARRVVQQLLSGSPSGTWTNGVVDRCYQQCDGNLREMLFLLYDQYERGEFRL